MRLRESLFVFLWPNSDNKILAHDAAAHMAINHKRESTEHSPLLGKTFFRQDVADSLGQTFIEGHRVSFGILLVFQIRDRIMRPFSVLIRASCRNGHALLT